MIRLGRNTKTEQQSEPANTQALYPATTSRQPAETRAISESESMARDIKEGRLSGFVGYGTVLTGETNFQAMLRVDGHLTGKVTSENGTLIVGSTGRVDANVLVSSAVVGGTINGDIIVTERLELGRTAHVIGNIQAPRLIVEDGAILEGNCVMIKARETMASRADADAAAQTQNDFSSYETTNEESENEAATGEENYETAGR